MTDKLAIELAANNGRDWADMGEHERGTYRDAAAQPRMKVVPHPLQLGKWAIQITDQYGTGLYGAYERRDLAVAVMLTS